MTSQGPPGSTWLLYLVGLVNLVLVWVAAGVKGGVWATGACLCFWAAAIMHERYTIK